MKRQLMAIPCLAGALLLAACASERGQNREPNTSKETGEAVEAVGDETEQAADEVQEEIHQGAQSVESSTRDDDD